MEKWVQARYLGPQYLGEGHTKATCCEKHLALSQRAAAAGMVLLKNERHALPLSPEEPLVFFGKASVDYVKGGGGSGDVFTGAIDDIIGAFGARGNARFFQDTISFYDDYVKKQLASGYLPGMMPEPELPAGMMEKAAAFGGTAVLSFSRFSGEGWDRGSSAEHAQDSGDIVRLAGELFPRGDFYLSDPEKALLNAVCKNFGKVIVLLNVGGMMETACFKENPSVSAVLLTWQGGIHGCRAARDILLGTVSPSGHLPDTFARDLADYPGVSNFFDSDDYVEYEEDIYVGYRYFETIPGARERVVYPFGYGLSYASFSLCDLRLVENGGTFAAEGTVVHTGGSPAPAVVQLYVRCPQGKLGKPQAQLVGYAKTRVLCPDDSSDAFSISFSLRDFASYDDTGKVHASSWVLEKGTYEFLIGWNVQDTQPLASYTVPEDRILEELAPRLVPSRLRRRLCSDGSFEPLPCRIPDPDPCVLPRQNIAEMEGRYPGEPGYPALTHAERAALPKLEAVADGSLSLDAFIHALPEEALLSLLGGQPNTGIANTFGFGNLPQYGVPNCMTADGPAGIRFDPRFETPTTAFPCATLLASTFDRDLLREIGKAGALEARENHITTWLTPGVCIHRNPLCGRNFEYYSEDPLLTAQQAGALIQGIQSMGVAATPKHFAFNNKETNRKSSDSRVSERAAREIYLRQFEYIVRDAHPYAIMSSYNLVNGVHTSESHDLLTCILREEWGFDGMVTTDWWAFSEQYLEVLAGNDLKMGSGYPERLKLALEKGALSRGDLESAASHILKLILRLA